MALEGLGLGGIQQHEVVGHRQRRRILCDALQQPPLVFTQSHVHTSLRFTEHLALEGIAPSIGTVGDAYDNGLMEGIIGPFKTECIRTQRFHIGPYKTGADVEYATAGWVDWYNQRRLHGSLGMVPPAEFEQDYYAALKPQGQPESGTKVGTLHWMASFSTVAMASFSSVVDRHRSCQVEATATAVFPPRFAPLQLRRKPNPRKALIRRSLVGRSDPLASTEGIRGP
jgi:hypothetical protein